MGTFTIIPTFDSSVTSSAVAAQFESAVNTAIQYFEGVITNPITITIAFGYGENGGTTMQPASGASSSVSESGISWTTLYDAVQTTDTTSAVQRAAASLLTAADPTNGTGNFFIAPAEAMALGLAPASTAAVGTVGLSVDTYNWSETGTQNPNGSDAVSEFEHEISEVLGRTDFGGGNNDYNLMDMFRYTAAGGASGAAPGSAAGALDQPFVTGYNANAASYFSYNGTTVTLQYDTPTEVQGGADIADWTATVPNDSFDGSGGPGTIDPVSATDLQVLNVLGYSLAQCFIAGTRIATPGGAAPVESLRPGDLVRTADGDVLPVRFVGRQTVRTRAADPLILPIRIRAGALADQVPSRDLVLSPATRCSSAACWRRPARWSTAPASCVSRACRRVSATGMSNSIATPCCSPRAARPKATSRPPSRRASTTPPTGRTCRSPRRCRIRAPSRHGRFRGRCGFGWRHAGRPPCPRWRSGGGR
jgi:hypothetical protein